jgi:phage regulator Rha-like protein
MNKLVTVNNGVASTNSLFIAELFDRPHKNVLQSLDKLVAGLGFKLSSFIDESGKTNRMYELTERQALIAMPFIGGLKSVDGQVALVDAFLALRSNSKSMPAIESKNKALESDVYIVHDTIKRHGINGVEIRALARLSNMTQPACKRILKILTESDAIEWRDTRKNQYTNPDIRYYAK